MITPHVKKVNGVWVLNTPSVFWNIEQWRMFARAIVAVRKLNGGVTN